MFLRIKVKPNARKNELQKLPGGSLRVKIKAPAQDGKANEALIEFLSDLLKLSKSKIRIVSGHTAPFKKLEIDAEEEYILTKILV